MIFRDVQIKIEKFQNCNKDLSTTNMNYKEQLICNLSSLLLLFLSDDTAPAFPARHPKMISLN
jgi:hypothetical protein